MFTEDLEARMAAASEIEGGPSHVEVSAADPAAEKLRAFQCAWFQAVALAWSDPALLAELKRAPARFLAAHCGYALPASVELTVHAASELPEGHAHGGWDAQREAWSLPKTEITVYVPPAPELSEREVALAELEDPCECIPVCC